jgi:hypothetical protein
VKKTNRRRSSDSSSTIALHYSVQPKINSAAFRQQGILVRKVYLSIVCRHIFP